MNGWGARAPSAMEMTQHAAAAKLANLRGAGGRVQWAVGALTPPALAEPARAEAAELGNPPHPESAQGPPSPHSIQEGHDPPPAHRRDPRPARWRWASLGAHASILVVSCCLWAANLSPSGRWGRGLHRRWGVTYLQLETCTARYARPVAVVGCGPWSTPASSVVGDAGTIGGGVVWRRDASGGFEDAAADCAKGSPPTVYDYSVWGVPPNATPLLGAAFLGDVDVAALSTLVLWVSTSHCIFTLPNSNHLQPLMAPRLWRHNWVAMALVGWNALGLAIVFGALVMGAITPPTATVCASSIVSSASLHFLWAYLSRRAQGGLLPEQVDYIVERWGGAGGDGGLPRPHSLQHWVQFMRANEISLSAPMLMVCWMASVQDQQSTVSMQYVLGFVAAGTSLLIPLDALAMASQEETAYSKLLCAGQPMGDLRGAGAQECARQVIAQGGLASVRIFVVGGLMIGWGVAIYADAVWSRAFPGPTEAGAVDWVARACLVAAPLYPVLGLLLGVCRNMLRGLGAGGATAKSSGEYGAMRRFLGVQCLIDEAHVVAWDLLGLLFKGALTIGLCVRGYDSWVT